MFSRRKFLAAGALIGLSAVASGEGFLSFGPEPEIPESFYDAIVVGGSYAGLAAALQLARAQRSVLVLDSGLPRNRFAREVHGFLGHDGKAPTTILAESTKQLLAYPSAVFKSGLVSEANRDERGFCVNLGDGTVRRSARLILATGVKDELPPIVGLQERWGVTVLHCPYCHGYEVRDRKLGVLATHPLSLSQAKLMPDWGATTLFTQGVLEPDEEEIARLSSRGVTIERTPVVEFLGKSPELEAVRLSDGRVISLGAMFVIPESRMASPLAENLGCEFEKGPVGNYLRTVGMNETTVPGVYAAGDIANPIHKVSIAAASGVVAGIGAHQSLS